jgi:hypothetical protein
MAVLVHFAHAVLYLNSRARKLYIAATRITTEICKKYFNIMEKASHESERQIFSHSIATVTFSAFINNI